MITMAVWFADGNAKIYQGKQLDVLRTIAEYVDEHETTVTDVEVR